MFFSLHVFPYIFFNNKIFQQYLFVSSIYNLARLARLPHFELSKFKKMKTVKIGEIAAQICEKSFPRVYEGEIKSLSMYKFKSAENGPKRMRVYVNVGEQRENGD